MKILHLLGVSQDSGGVLSVIRNLQEAGKSMGLAHVALVNRAYVEERKPALDYRRNDHLLGESPGHLRLLTAGLRAYPGFKRLLAKESFDVLHAHHRGALPLCLLAAASGRLIVYTNHTYANRRWLYRGLARHRGLLTCVLTPNMLRHYGLAAVPGQVEVVSECCADRFFELPLVTRPAAGGTLRLAGVGNIVRWKNWHLLLQALALLTEIERRRIEFRHWGPVAQDDDSAAYDQELRALIRQHNLAECVSFLGSSRDMVADLKWAEWFVLPSTNEPCSVALIEALALGLPALVSDSGGNVDIVQPGRSGLLFQPDDPADLATRLRDILGGTVNPVAPEVVRETVRARSASQVTAQYADIYRRVAYCDSAPSPR
jgi:glycosyltransferase involved in cell wall biosynthesis